MAKLSFGEKIHVCFLKLVSRLFLSYKKNFNPKELKKGLIFCQMGIGNCILFLPVINNLLQKSPDLELVILTDNHVKYELLKNQFSDIHIIIWKGKKRSVTSRMQFYWKMRKEQFDFSIMNFLGQKRENVYLHLFSGIPLRIGHKVKDAGGRGKYDFLYNFSFSIKGKHELDFNCDLLQSFININPIDKSTFLHVNYTQTQRARSFIESLNEKYKIVFQVYSSLGVHKNWFGSYYVDLCKKIKQQYDAALILLGSKNEKSSINQIFSDVSFNFYNVAGDFSIMETAEIIRLSDLFIGNDSGLGHIAAALNQHTISIIAMTDYNRIRPVGNHVHVFYEELSCSPCSAIGVYPLYLNCPYDYLCKRRITPEKVFNTIQKFLQ